MIKLDRYKDGKKWALTMSYDDGVVHDRRLVEIFDKYNIKATFHLNSGNIGRDGLITADEASALYKEHEVATHTVTHPRLTNIAPVNIIQETLDDRRALENLCGYIVRGMSYPHGAYNDNVINVLRQCGIVYSRTTKSTGGFGLPDDFMAWHPTCHHKQMLTLADKFAEKKIFERGGLFYIWGHSYEFEGGNSWKDMELFCQRMSGLSDVWYATNIEIYEYIAAQRSLHISVENKMIHNPSCREVWVSRDGEAVKIPGGETVRFS